VTATSRRRLDRSARSGATSMSVETVHADRHRALVRVAGELDLATAAPLWAVLRGHLDAGRRFVRLDVAGVTFLDATALGGITVAHHEALARRGTLVITGVHSAVARLLQLTGLHDVLFIAGPAPAP
jgi:anti-sigma B factor antagonist